MSTLKDSYHQNMTLAEAEKLVVQALKQVMEEKISTENVELCVIRSDTKVVDNKSQEYIGQILNQLN